MGFPYIYLMRRGHCLLVAHRQPAGPVAPWRRCWSVYISASTLSRYRSVSLIDRCTHRHSAVTPMTGSEVGGSLARLGGLPDPPGEGEERQDGLAAWGVQVGRVKPCCST